MSSKMIVLSMISVLLIVFLIVLFITFRTDRSTPSTSLQFPLVSSKDELVSFLLDIHEGRLRAAEVVLERGVPLRPIQEYAKDLAVRERALLEEHASVSRVDTPMEVGPVDWSLVADDLLMREYIQFEKNSVYLLKEGSVQMRYDTADGVPEKLKESQAYTADEARLHELEVLLPHN